MSDARDTVKSILTKTFELALACFVYSFVYFSVSIIYMYDFRKFQIRCPFGANNEVYTSVLDCFSNRTTVAEWFFKCAKPMLRFRDE